LTELDDEPKDLFPVDMEAAAIRLNLKDEIKSLTKLGLADPENRSESIDDAIKLIKN